MRISIINGPNLNLLGVREKSLYGDQSFEDYLSVLKNEFSNINLDYFQSNHEGELIDHLQQVGFSADGIIFNPGGYTHSSIALADAARSISCPVIEVHISNLSKREAYRKKSYLSEAALGTITGLGLEGYRLAIRYFIEIKK
jgi:3-dehydroquinate dehydratase-2